MTDRWHDPETLAFYDREAEAYAAQRLRAAYDAAGPWTELEFRTGAGGGYDGLARTWMHMTVARP